MNTPITLRFLFAAATLFVFGQTARAQDAAPSKATVTFENPERFTDVKDSKDIYMPRMKFTYAITDEAGAVVKEGTENLSDVNYLQNIGIVGRNDPLYHDLTMLRDWLRKTLK